MILNNTVAGLNFDLADEVATEALAMQIAGIAQRRDVIALIGDIGTGKTTFARAFIRAYSNSDEEVPSPTFTLLQIYEASDTIIYHFDLYRIERVEDMLELGIEEAFTDGITLIEWGERLGAHLPTNRLDIHLFPGKSDNSRRAKLMGCGYWQTKLDEEFNHGTNHD